MENFNTDHTAAQTQLHFDILPGMLSRFKTFEMIDGPSGYGKGGQRLYTLTDWRQIQAVIALQRCGVSRADIRRMRIIEKAIAYLLQNSSGEEGVDFDLNESSLLFYPRNPKEWKVDEDEQTQFDELMSGRSALFNQLSNGSRSEFIGRVLEMIRVREEEGRMFMPRQNPLKSKRNGDHRDESKISSTPAGTDDPRQRPEGKEESWDPYRREGQGEDDGPLGSPQDNPGPENPPEPDDAAATDTAEAA